jgi:quinol monooxygenase YgiN
VDHRGDAARKEVAVYGTVARIRIKPGMEAQLQAEMDAFKERRVPGFVAEYVFRMDADPDETYMVAIFASKEAYRANANSPDQDAQYQRLVQLWEGEPEWHDGEIIHSLTQGS